MTTPVVCAQCGEEAMMLKDGSIYCGRCGRLDYVDPENEIVDLDEDY